jgi:hypothetical protein
MKNEFYQSPEPTWLMKQFWKACGADSYLLQKSTYSDQIKYFCLGGIVVATGVMAAMAGGYAFYTIFSPKNPINGDLEWSTSAMIFSVFFGIVWGLIIYNIDRFIVTSTGKGDGTEAITGQELKSSIPRIIMGIIIALTISKPIEIRMFQTEIQTKLVEKKEAMKRRNVSKIEKRFQTALASKDNEIKSVNNRIDNAFMNYQNKYEMWSQQTKICQCTAPIHKAESDLAKDNWQALKNGSQPDILRLNMERNKILSDKQIELQHLNINSEGLNGLSIRIQLAEEVAGPWISWFVTLLFMVIELTPIFFKMMLIKGPYDYMDENVKELARAEAGIEIIYNFYEDGEGMEAHKVVNHNAELKYRERMLIVKAQEELNEQIVSAWKEKRRKQIKDNPEQFISED